MTKSKHQHVVPHHQGWAVKAAGAKKATQVFSTEKEAIKRAREIAQNQQSEVVIHSSSGQFQDQNSYSKDFNPLPKQNREATQHSYKDTQTQTSGDTAYDSTARPLWELIVEIGAQVPDEEWAKMPTDLSKNVDHYLYGAPKDDE